MHIHISGICGTFMAGVAVLARELGDRVTGSDQNVYPPMSTLLESQGIPVVSGYRAENLDVAPELVVIGNALSRGNAEVEAVLERGLRYTSGAQWLADRVLHGRWVIAVAGTHGKTTTASMVAWILDYAGLAPGFLIGGVPQNFGCSARLGTSPFFVVEADEYDTAFFDKRSKFVHYRPRTAVLNNLEFDHADIFPDIGAIETQFHHLVRTVPGNGLLVVNGGDAHLQRVLARGCWSPVERFGIDAAWRVDGAADDGSSFRVLYEGAVLGEVRWELLGHHNIWNAVAAIAAARHAGVAPALAIEALASFRSVKRRLEVRYQEHGVTVYDDFAHHPTEILATLQAIRARAGAQRVIAVLEPRSNSMRMGAHRAQLAASLAPADSIELFQPPALGWDLSDALDTVADRLHISATVDDMVARLVTVAASGDHIVIMSNGGFGGIHDKLTAALAARAA